MTDVAITADGLTKVYSDEVAVEDLSLSIPAESAYGFRGPNGAGKTTTMWMLTSRTKPTSDTATVAGARHRPRSHHRTHRLPVGRTPVRVDERQ